jgi:hypothetical protein
MKLEARKSESATERMDLALRDIAKLLKNFSPKEKGYLGQRHDSTSNEPSPLV